MSDMRETPEHDPLAGTSKPLRSATYLLRFTPEDKAQLEQKVRYAAALGKNPLTLAEALRMGAHVYLDEMIEKLRSEDQPTDGDHGGLALS